MSSNYISKLTPDQVCVICHSPIEFHCVKIAESEYDFWYYCTNSNCNNYHGETTPYNIETPNWIDKAT
mgnify:FL=1